MSKKDKFVILVNGGLYGGGNVFSREELDGVFEEWNKGEVMLDEDEFGVSVSDLIEVGSIGEKINIVNESMVEVGDEWVEVSVVKLNL
jgi:hypothetical protein